MSPMVITLRNGHDMPMVGLGTWRSPPSVITNVVKDAIDLGYRHFDCAHIYGNEPQIGNALEEKIQNGAVTREELFVTSKLWNTHHRPESVREACEASLAALKLSYLDLYLMHWPMAYKEGEEPYPKDETGKLVFSFVDYVDTWKAMEALVRENLCRSIGISNFNISQIQELLKIATIKPQVLQVESHPYLAQDELIEFCKENGLVFTAYSPLGSAHTPYAKPGDYPLLKNPVIRSIANAHNCSTAQVLLRYQVQRGNVVIPRSIDKTHLETNIALEDIVLTDEELDKLKGLDMGENGRIVRMDICRNHPYYPFKKPDEDTDGE